MRRTVLVVVALATLVAGCTSVLGGHGRADGVASVTGGVRAPTPTRLPLPAGVRGDGETQYLSGLAESHGVIVAVGGTHTAGVWHPLLLSSRDDGRTWRIGTVVAGAEQATVVDTADTVVVRGGHFLALGDAAAGVSVWTSSDGLHWARHAVDRAVMGGALRVGGIAPTSSGYVAVGYSTAAGHRETPVVWMSVDGVRWNRHGLPGAAGADVDLFDVAAASDGRHLVAVGEIESGNGSHTAPVVRTSADAGRTWRAVALRPGLAGDGTRSWLSTVRWVGGQFAAVGSGGDADEYSGVVATSVDGRAWSAVSGGAGVRSGGEVFLNSVVRTRTGLRAFGQRCTATCVGYGVAGSGSRYRAVSVDAGTATSDVTVSEALTTSRGTVLLAGSADPRADYDARIWRSEEATAPRPVSLRGVEVASTPTASVSDLVFGGGLYYAAGSAAGYPVVWTSKDGTTFGPPHLLADDRAYSAGSISWGPEGLLVTGTQDVGANSQALVWTSADGTQWTASKAATFGAADAFASSTLGEAADRPQGWVVVGTSTTDGYQYGSALAFHRSVAGTWTPGTPAEYGALAGGDGQRTMASVTWTGTLFAAVGTGKDHTASTVTRPAYWQSSDGGEWGLQWLPVPAGITSGYPSAIAAAGPTLVAVGTGDTGDIVRACVWFSGDNSNTWSARTLPGAGGLRAQLSINEVVRTRSGFEVIGTGGAPGAARVIAWTSRDGRAWSARPLTDPRLRASGDWSVDGVTYDGRSVLAAVSSTTTSGVRTFTVRL